MFPLKLLGCVSLTGPFLWSHRRKSRFPWASLAFLWKISRTVPRATVKLQAVTWPPRVCRLFIRASAAKHSIPFIAWESKAAQIPFWWGLPHSWHFNPAPGTAEDIWKNRHYILAAAAHRSAWVPSAWGLVQPDKHKQCGHIRTNSGHIPPVGLLRVHCPSSRGGAFPSPKIEWPQTPAPPWGDLGLSWACLPPRWRSEWLLYVLMW